MTTDPSVVRETKEAPVPSGTEKVSRFKIQNLADIDELKEYRETAELMQVGQVVTDLSTFDALRLAKAICDKHGNRTCRVETKGGLKRVIRIEQRQLRPRKVSSTPKIDALAAAAKKTASIAKKAGKGA